jgi:hypothetical protein
MGSAEAFPVQLPAACYLEEYWTNLAARTRIESSTLLQQPLIIDVKAQSFGGCKKNRVRQ